MMALTNDNGDDMGRLGQALLAGPSAAAIVPYCCCYLIMVIRPGNEGPLLPADAKH